jgi:uncharacterized protein YndB with AHSA1/START domain
MSEGRFATLSFSREVAAPVATLWQAWISPAARAVWSAPAPGVTVEYSEADARVGGIERSICRVDGYPDVHVEGRWLELLPGRISVNSEVVASEGATESAALVTAEFLETSAGSRIAVTVQLTSLSQDMVGGYQHGFNGGLDNLVGVAERSMVISRVIKAPVAAVWGAWVNAESLPKWWGPDGFSCKTKRIDLAPGGEWVFDMIAPDGTVFPNHHRYGAMIPEVRLDYVLLWGENGTKHADAWASFAEKDGVTTVTLGMVMATREEWQNAKGFGAEALGLQTLGKLARAVGAG